MKNFVSRIYDDMHAILAFAMFVMVCILLFPLTLLAEESTEIPPMPSTESFMEALGERHWPLAVALGVTILVWVIRYVIKDKIPVSIIPYVMLACTVLSTGAARIIQAVSENHTWWMAMIQGLLEGATVGLGSMGMWSAGMKKALPSPQRE